MKISNLFYHLSFFFLLLIQHIQSKGFLPHTKVKTTSGYSSIRQLKANAFVLSYDNTGKQQQTSLISHNTKSTSNHYIKITIGDTTICCAPDQKFYAYNQQQWITADQLRITDLLINSNNQPITTDSIELVKKDCTFYALSLEPNHTYYISHHDILVHNAVHMMIISMPGLMSLMEPIVQTCLAGAATFFGIHFFAKKAKHKLHASSQNSASSSNYGSYYPDPNDPNDDKNESKDKEHPHGIYKDADYHHKNSSGPKSPSPDNGQHCLDYSIRVGDQRVAIEGNHFVVLRLTRPGEYHGFQVPWNRLHDKLQTALIKHGFVKKTGKIIRQITKKFPS